MLPWFLASCGLFQPPAAPPPEAPDPDPMVEMSEKKAVKMPHDDRLDPVDWKAAFARQRIDDAYVTDEIRAARQVSDVPVLLPNDPELLRDVKIYSGEGWYSATLKSADRHVLVRGTRRAHSVDLTDADQAHLGASDTVMTSVTEGIVTASFSLFGAAYNLEIECMTEPSACADESTARQYVQGLGLAGAKP